MENSHCFVLFPIHHADIWQMYKKAKTYFWFWSEEEIDLSAKLADWSMLSKTECHFISHVLAFFATSNGIVNKNLSSNFSLQLPSCNQKHPQQNILPPHQHLHQGSKGEITPAPHHQNSAVHSMQSQLGSQMVQPHQCQFFQTKNCICCC